MEKVVLIGPAKISDSEPLARPPTIPIWHPNCMLWECEHCGDVAINGTHRYCPTCGYLIDWDHEEIH